MPLFFKNWELAVHLACNYPCSLTSPRNLTKLPPQTGKLLNTQDGRLFKYSTVAFPLGGVRGLCIQSMQGCIKAANTSVDCSDIHSI